MIDDATLAEFLGKTQRIAEFPKKSVLYLIIGSVLGFVLSLLSFLVVLLIHSLGDVEISGFTPIWIVCGILVTTILVPQLIIWIDAAMYIICTCARLPEIKMCRIMLGQQSCFFLELPGREVLRYEGSKLDCQVPHRFFPETGSGEIDVGLEDGSLRLRYTYEACDPPDLVGLYQLGDTSEEIKKTIGDNVGFCVASVLNNVLPESQQLLTDKLILLKALSAEGPILPREIGELYQITDIEVIDVRVNTL